MLKLRKVAVTGGLSTGKSSVCRILKELGAAVISADKIVHQLLSSDTNLGQEVIKLLGTKILSNNQINRAQMAQIVFQDPDLLKKLEALLHPAVYMEIDNEFGKLQKSPSPPPLFAAEVPLLFESKGEKKFDLTVAVVANPDVCAERFEKKYGYDRNEFDNRTANQMPQMEKALRADYVITNSGSLSHLKDLTKELYQELTEFS